MARLRYRLQQGILFHVQHFPLDAIYRIPVHAPSPAGRVGVGRGMFYSIDVSCATILGSGTDELLGEFYGFDAVGGVGVSTGAVGVFLGEGGAADHDFRQAAWRAIRQGLMTAREQGGAVLLEPWYRFELEVPMDKVGRAMADLQRMSARFSAPLSRDDMALLEGEVPASEVGDYALDVAAYTGGNGSLTCELLGYEPCHDAGSVIEASAYDPEADLPHTPDSVFCSHGAGYTVKWFEASGHMHVTDDPARERPWRAADASFFVR